jgi:hypothetical protein
MNLNFPPAFVGLKERSHRTPWSCPSLQFYKILSRFWPNAKITCALATLFEKASRAQAARRSKPLPAATENRCGTEGVLRPGLSFA